MCTTLLSVTSNPPTALTISQSLPLKGQPGADENTVRQRMQTLTLMEKSVYTIHRTSVNWLFFSKCSIIGTLTRDIIFRPLPVSFRQFLSEQIVMRVAKE